MLVTCHAGPLPVTPTTLSCRRCCCAPFRDAAFELRACVAFRVSWEVGSGTQLCLTLKPNLTRSADPYFVFASHTWKSPRASSPRPSIFWAAAPGFRVKPRSLKLRVIAAQQPDAGASALVKAFPGDSHGQPRPRTMCPRKQGRIQILEFIRRVCGDGTLDLSCVLV